MIPIKVVVHFDPKLNKTVEKLLAIPNRLKDMRPLMEQGIAPATTDMLRRHWDSKGAAFGHKWAPLMPETIRKRTRRGTISKGILRDNDHLFRNIFRRASAGGVRRIRNGLRFSATTGVRYAVFHQVGTQFMAERLVIPDPLPASFRQLVTRMVKTYIRTGNVG